MEEETINAEDAKPKEYVGEYIIDTKESSREATLEDAQPYFKFLIKYLNKHQDKFTVETLLDYRIIDEQVHIFVKLVSMFQNINHFFEYLNSQCSLAYVEVMTSDAPIWGDIIRLYQYRFWNQAEEQKKKINDAELQDDDGWIPLERLKEGLEKQYVLEHPDINEKLKNNNDAKESNGEKNEKSTSNNS